MKENVIKVQFRAINEPIISAFIQVRNITYGHKVCVYKTKLTLERGNFQRDKTEKIHLKQKLFFVIINLLYT